MLAAQLALFRNLNHQLSHLQEMSQAHLEVYREPSNTVEFRREAYQKFEAIQDRMTGLRQDMMRAFPPIDPVAMRILDTLDRHMYTR